MRKSKLIKAMACFTAATMALTGTPSSRISNGRIVKAAESSVEVTGSTKTPVTVDGTAGWWRGFSDYYTVAGDFDVTFEIQLPNTELKNNWNTPSFVFTTNAERGAGADAYKEYALIRSDCFGWGGGDNKTVDGNDIVYEADWLSGSEDKEVTDSEWANFRKFMKNAKITSNITRKGNDFVMNNTISGGDGNTYHYKVSFTTAADNVMNLFLVADTSTMTINSFTNNKETGSTPEVKPPTTPEVTSPGGVGSAEITESTKTPVTVDGTAGWWTGFSDYYTVAGDFDVTLEIQMPDTEPANSWNTPVFVFTINAERSADSYKEYAVIRSDCFGWGGGNNKTVDGNDIVYETDWLSGSEDKEVTDSEWANFRKFMKNAKITSNITRKGNDFVMNNTISGGDGNTYHYKVSFTTAADNVMNLFLVADTSTMTINSFTNNKETGSTPEVKPPTTPGAITTSGGIVAGIGEEIDGSAGWWKAFSETYTMKGDFDVTFKIKNKGGRKSYYNPCTVFSNVADRNTEKYQEYVLVRSDGYGWGNASNEAHSGQTYDGNYISSTQSWSDWDQFTSDMQDAEITKKIIRTGNSFYIKDTIKAKNGRTYVSTTTFWSEVPEEINLFLTPDTSKMTITSYSGNILSEKNTAYYDYERYVVWEGPAVTKKEDGTYVIDLTQIFKKELLTETTLTMKEGGIADIILKNEKDTMTVPLEFVIQNPCKNIKLEKDTYKVAVNNMLNVSTELEGVNADGRLTETPSLFCRALPNELRMFFSVDNGYIEMKSVKDNNTNTTKEINQIVGKEDRTSMFWTDFSDYYSLKRGDDLTFEFINHGGTFNWNNYLAVFTSDADRGTENYKEYEVLRADAYGWTAEETVEQTVNYQYDWNWEEFVSIMQDAEVSMNVKYHEDSIVIVSQITPLKQVGSKETYTYTVEMNYHSKLEGQYFMRGGYTMDSSDFNKGVCSALIVKEGTYEFLVNCGTATPKAITVEAINNKCKELSGKVSYPRKPVTGQEVRIVVTAAGIDSDLPLNDQISIASSGALTANGHIYCSESTNENGVATATYTMRSFVPISSTIEFVCGDKKIEVPYTIEQAEPLVTPAAITATSSEKVELDGLGGFWSDFSDNYVLTGDFDVTFDLQLPDEEPLENWYTPIYILSNAAKRNSKEEGYKEYAVIRTDGYAWSYQEEDQTTVRDRTLEGNEISYQCSWIPDSFEDFRAEETEEYWKQFRKIMKNAKITTNLVRKGDDFELNSIIYAEDGKEYSYQVKFTTKAEETIYLALTTDNSTAIINSFVKADDFVNNDKLIEGITFKDGIYEVRSDAAGVKKATGGFEVDLSKIFVPADAGTKILEADKVTEVPVTVNGITKKFKLKLVDVSPKDEPGDSTGGNSGNNGGTTTGGSSGSTGGTTTGGNSGSAGGTTTGGNSGSTTTDKGNEGASQNKPVTETKPDGTKVETSTETKADGTKTEAVTETKTDGSKTETVTETKTDGSKTETVKETKADGSTAETVKETKADGSTAETVKETKADGSKTETVKETKADGSTAETVKETKADGSKTETVKETKTDGSKTETVKETKADGSTAEIVKETKADGSSKETKEITTADNTASLKTTAETDKNGKTTADAVISTGVSKKAGVIEIAKELLESAAEVVNSFVVEISKDTIQSTDAKKVNTVVNISIPSVEGIDVDKVVLNKESIQAAKETGKGLKVNVANGDGASADSYTVTIPVKQLAKIKNSVENLNITINTNNAKDAAAENKALTKAMTASKANQKKTCVVSVAENNQTKNVGMKVTIPVTGKSDIKKGNKVYVYKFNKETGKLEEAANSKQTVSADGTIAIAAASGSDYIVSAKKLAGKNVETIKDKIDVSLPKNEVKAGKEMKVKVSLPDTVSTKAKFGTEKAEITYKSGNKGVASVSSNGTITTKKKGTVTITTVIKLESGQKITQKQKITIK